MVLVDGAGLVLLCFLCFFTVVVSVELDGAGVCAITVPIMRERPIRADAKVFIVFIPLFLGCRYSASTMRDVRAY